MKHTSIREKILRVYQENHSRDFNISNLVNIIHRSEDIVADQLDKMEEMGILYRKEGLRYLHQSYRA